MSASASPYMSNPQRGLLAARRLVAGQVDPATAARLGPGIEAALGPDGAYSYGDVFAAMEKRGAVLESNRGSHGRAR